MTLREKSNWVTDGGGQEKAPRLPPTGPLGSLF